MKDIDHSELFKEIVLYQDEVAKKTHKELFSFNDACYFVLGESIIDSALSAAREDIAKLHITAGWENMLRLALWTSDRPAMHEVLSLIKKAGVMDEELLPFKKSDIDDIFPWLFYGKRFDVLRRICNAAKARTELKIDKKKVLVYCHLVSDETGKIVSSSL